jgi:hypothetical protein
MKNREKILCNHAVNSRVYNFLIVFRIRLTSYENFHTRNKSDSKNCERTTNSWICNRFVDNFFQIDPIFKTVMGCKSWFVALRIFPRIKALHPDHKLSLSHSLFSSYSPAAEWSDLSGHELIPLPLGTDQALPYPPRVRSQCTVRRSISHSAESTQIFNFLAFLPGSIPSRPVCSSRPPVIRHRATSEGSFSSIYISARKEAPSSPDDVVLVV